MQLDNDSQRARRNSLEECFKVGLSDADLDPMGNCPLKYLSAQKIKRMIEAVDGPGARANRRKHLSALCAWAVDQTPPFLPSDPVGDVKAGREIKGDWIQYIPKKTLKQRREVSQTPLPPVLKEIIGYSKCGATTFPQTAYGKPFTEAGNGN